jgi:hypothetical protein
MQKYFVTYHKIEYPNCRTTGKDAGGKIKGCFKNVGCCFENKDKNKNRLLPPHPPEYDKNTCTECRIMDKLFHANRGKVNPAGRNRKERCVNYSGSTCGRGPHCTNRHCPEMTRQAVYRVLLAEFDDEERDLFIKKTGIATADASFCTSNRPEFSLDTGGESKEEKLEHQRLLRKFEEGPVDALGQKLGVAGWGESVVKTLTGASWTRSRRIWGQSLPGTSRKRD